MSQKKTALPLAFVSILSLVGAGSAIYLTRLYYGLRTGTGGFSSLCNINATMNCDAVTTSRFAEIIPGLPLSSFVAGFFIAMLGVSLMARVTDWRKEAIAAGTLLSGFASLYSIVLLVVMFGVLHKICLFCLVIDAVNFATLGIFLWLAGGKPFAGIRWAKLQSYAALFAGALFVTVVLLRPAEENARSKISSAEVQATVDQILARTPVEIAAPAGAHVFGAADAPITIYEFLDFQCPFCKRGALQMHQLLARHEGKIKVISMPFPLDPACNRVITRSLHPYACQLAKTAFCAGKEGKFQPVYEKIFEDQEFLTADSAKKIAEANGISGDRLQTCLDSEEAKQYVSASIEEGLKAKVESTPMFFVNGRKVEGVPTSETWDLLIANLLRK